MVGEQWAGGTVGGGTVGGGTVDGRKGQTEMKRKKNPGKEILTDSRRYVGKGREGH